MSIQMTVFQTVHKKRRLSARAMAGPSYIHSETRDANFPGTTAAAAEAEADPGAGASAGDKAARRRRVGFWPEEPSALSTVTCSFWPYSQCLPKEVMK